MVPVWLLVFDLFPLGITLSLFAVFRWWDRRKPVERRDDWGPWGFLLPASAFTLGSYLFPLVVTLLTLTSDTFLSPFAATHLALLGGMTLMFALFIYWSLAGHKKRLEQGLGDPPAHAAKVRH